MNTPELNEIPLHNVFPIDPDKPQIVITMSEGQWDFLLQMAYDGDYVLLELNESEIPVRAYRRPRC